MADEIAHVFGFRPSNTYIRNLLKKHGHTFKKGQILQMQKFTPANIDVYINYIENIHRIDRNTVYFLDEASFQNRKQVNSYGWSARGGRHSIVTHALLGARSINVSIICSANRLKPPVYFEQREESNKAVDHFTFIRSAIAANYFEKFSVLVMDNARVHTSQEIIGELKRLAEGCSLFLVALPKYSPELNVCEKVFAQCKQFVSRNRRPGDHFETLIRNGFEAVTHETMQNYYNHCVNLDFVKEFSQADRSQTN